MQFIMEYTTLLHIDLNQVQALSQENAIYHEIRDVIAYRPQSGISCQQQNSVYHGIHDVIAYQP